MNYSIGELARSAGVTRRTVRFYVEEGLLPPPAGFGRRANYTEEHRERLGQIRTLKELRLSLDEIRDELARPVTARSPKVDETVSLFRSVSLDSGEKENAVDYLARLRDGMRGPSSARHPSARGRSSYGAEPWMRISLSDDVELHVRRGRSRSDPRLARLIEEARRILAEEENKS